MITTTFLKITNPSQLRSADEDFQGAAEINLKKVDCPIICSSMYSEVGKSQYWELYRIGWTSLHWWRYLHRNDIEIAFLCDKDGSEIGYLELKLHPDSSVEIVNFGLRPQFIGQGLGRSALASAVRRGFELGAKEVWLHTCSLDHPSALKNYYARGFQFVREEVTNYLTLDAPLSATNEAEEYLSEDTKPRNPVTASRHSQSAPAFSHSSFLYETI